jgi:competence protein ComEC
LRAWFSRFVQARLGKWKGLRGLARAVWLGDAAGLPEGMAALYREGGLLHLLALSGQHIASFWLVVRAALWAAAPLLVRSACGRWLFACAPALAASVGALFLCALNPGNEPMARATSMLLLFTLLRSRGLACSGAQLAASAAALLLLANPSRAASDSFCLSAIATAFLCVGFDKWGTGWRATLALCLAMPLLMLPVGAFFFATVAPMAPLNGLLLGGIWSLGWIPLGFAAPFLPDGVLCLLEGVWAGFAGMHETAREWVTAGYRPVPRPSLCEWALLQMAVCWSVFGNTHRVKTGSAL